MVAAAIIGSAVVGGVASSQASKSAANTQANAANNATQLQWNMYNQNRQDLSPWRTAGAGAVGQLSDLVNNPAFSGYFSGQGTNAVEASKFTPDALTSDPGYQFRLQQAQQALERSAAARGGSLGGAAIKGAVNYSQGLASQEYQAAYDRNAQAYQSAYDRYNNDRSLQYSRLSGLAGMGENAAGQTAGLGANAATQAGNNMMGAANAQAAGTVGQANAITGAINSGIGNYIGYGYLQNMNPLANPGAGTTGGNAANGLQFSPPSGWATSDERAKENIEQVGKTNDGTNVYKFNYIGDDEPRMGVMAGEVKKKQPDAVMTMANGLMAVDYDKIGKRAAMARKSTAGVRG